MGMPFAAGGPVDTLARFLAKHSGNRGSPPR
jgi:tripartite-type tricarboxylate transporter receptor subunit TctC